MDADHWIKIFEAITSLIQTLIWPLLLLAVLIYLRTPVKKLLSDLGKDKNMSELSAEAGPTGVKFNYKRQLEAVANLTAAVNQQSENGEKALDDHSIPTKTQEAVNAVNQVATTQTIEQIAGAKVLWVDDHPENNYYTRSALEALGIRFTISTSTEDALEKVHQFSYNVIISDMVRAPDKQAGYTLLERLQEEGFHIPYILFAGPSTPERKAGIAQRGGFAVANGAPDLFRLVIDAIKKG